MLAAAARQGLALLHERFRSVFPLTGALQLKHMSFVIDVAWL